MKLPVFCSLIPVELITSKGHTPVYVDANTLVQTKTQGYACSFNENICSYAKALFDYLRERQGEFGLIIIPTSCDAMKKLYNALKRTIPSEKLHILSVPHTKGELAQRFLSREFEKLAVRMGSTQDKQYSGTEAGKGDSKARTLIGILGANVPLHTLEDCLNKFGCEPVYLNHCLTKAKENNQLSLVLEKYGVGEYARLFLEEMSCPRTNDYGYKEKLKKCILGDDIKGLVVNTFKFCDFHPFDYMYFRNELGPDYPMLNVEYDLTANTEGQAMTRIEAFLEGLTGRPASRTGRQNKTTPKGAAKHRRYFVGIDSGSHASKLVCIDGQKEVISRDVVPTGTSVQGSSQELLQRLKKNHGIGRESIERTVATGYGRNNIGWADEVITEISCHARGAHDTMRKPATIIDIGGQDSKAIRILHDGTVVGFAMNDKCAAGTGRFLEVMASRLEMSLEEFAGLAAKTEKYVPISNMCSVFAESEIISLIASGIPTEEIAKGIHRAIAERTAALVRRADGKAPYYIAGGVAKNITLVKEIEKCLGEEINVLAGPQFNGAYGAALMALGGQK